MTAKRITHLDVLAHMRPGVPHALLDLATTSGISRGRMEVALEAGVRSRHFVKRYAPKEGRSNALNRRIVYFIAGTEPIIAARATSADTAAPISVCAASATGSIEAYATSLRMHRELAMSIRRSL
jgi:hypothetical protein